MKIINSCSLSARLRGELPPSVPLPATLQTVGGRWFPFAYLEYCQARRGDRFTVYPIDMPPFVFLSDPKDIQAVLTADPAELHPGAGAATIAPLIGERSFMLLEEEEHICGRRAITPAFHRRMVEGQAAMPGDVIEREVASWPLDCALALHPRVRSLTLRVILSRIFSDQDRALEPLHAQLMNMLSVTAGFLLQEPKLRHLPGWRGKWRRFVKQRAAADELIYELVRERRAREGGQTADLLDMLLLAENPDGSAMSEPQIRDNLMSMILAGHETTTGELSWAFQLLAHNPRVQDRLIEEIDGGCGEEYLTATVNETLRRKPVFPFTIPRKVVKPTEIGDWTYNPPAQLAGCTYLMHHNPELYPDPHSFRPERFIEETPRPRTWLPWGGGRKHCLGRHFALLEVRTILREVLSKRRVLPAADRIERPQWRSAILVPHAGGRVILRERR